MVFPGVEKKFMATKMFAKKSLFRTKIETNDELNSLKSNTSSFSYNLSECFFSALHYVQMFLQIRKNIHLLSINNHISTSTLFD